jgi:hypothetical protein
MTDTSAWGPLAGLIGTWEGNEGLDISYHNAHGQVRETPYREHISMDPFGPVANGAQMLYGLDYRMAAWRPGEDSPFHTEIGYWLWDAEDGQVIRCFLVPRGTAQLAGGPSSANASSFALEANIGSETYGILSNRYLAAKARTIKYTCQVSVADGVFSYESTTTYLHCVGGEIAHTDRNSLRRVPTP